jgi:16S rRNA (uracil1498-N3)-methyltransferase
VPAIHPPEHLVDWLPQATGLGLVLAPGAAQPLAALDARPGALSLLIGPEGGLAEGEIAAAQASGFIAVSLGPRVLRTETAAVVALALLQALAGDLGAA